MSSSPTSTSDTTFHLPALALRRTQAAKALGISERKLWELTADQTSGIPHFKIGTAVVYPVRELQDWLADQTNYRRTPSERSRS